MAFINNLYTWTQDYYPLLVFVVVIILVANFKKITSLFRKKEVKQERTFDDVGLFESAPDTGAGLMDQKVLAEKWVASILAQGRNLNEREKQMDAQYYQSKEQIRQQRQELGVKYSNWKNYLRSIEEIMDKKQKAAEMMR